MPICDGVEACKRIRVLENKRRTSALLPSGSPCAVDVRNAKCNAFASRRPQRRLPRVHEAALSKRRDEYIPQQTAEKEYASSPPLVAD